MRLLQWSSGQNETNYDLRLVTALGYFWYYDGQSIDEARHWAGLALEKSKNAAPQATAGVLMTAGRLAVAYGDMVAGIEYLSHAHKIFTQMGDENQAAWSLIYLSYAHTSTQEGAKEALGSCKQGLDYFRGVNDLLGIAQALNILGELSRMLGDYESARLYYEDCLRVAQETGERLRIPIQYENLSTIAYHQNRPEEGVALGKKGDPTVL